MDLILKSQTSDILLSDVGVLIKTGAGSSFNDPDANASIRKALGGSTVLRALVAANTVVVNDGTQDLGTLAGLQYLNKQWFQSGSDIAVAMGQVEGVITDTQHGSRGAGTLHPLANGSNPGFLTAADFTKLAGIGSGSQPQVSVSMGDSNGPGTATSSQTPTIERYAMYPGTNVWTPNIFRVIAQTTGALGYVDVYDVTNGQVLATVSFSGAAQVISTSTFTNLPANMAVIAFRAYRGGTATTITTFFCILTRT